MASSKAISHQHASPAHRARQVPIGDYGFLSDGEVCALLAPGGSIDWMCIPRFDSGSVFGRMLGRHAGVFRISPVDVEVPADVRYVPGTMIVETSWGTPTGWIVVRDCLLMGPWRHEESRSKTHRRTPNDYDAEHILLRTIRCVSGEVQVVVDCEPVLDYGRKAVDWKYTEHGYHQGVATADGSDLEMKLTTDLRLGFEGAQASARTLLKEGDTRFLALSWGSKEPPLTYADAYSRQVWTAH
ncbi:MAG TPA: trehalase-like domain-containing protein, partial [Microlunatus sp.]|nr:trehalase-like domain-containing protein [Microlunatus sp.]